MRENEERPGGVRLYLEQRLAFGWPAHGEHILKPKSLLPESLQRNYLNRFRSVNYPPLLVTLNPLATQKEPERSVA